MRQKVTQKNFMFTIYFALILFYQRLNMIYLLYYIDHQLTRKVTETVGSNEFHFIKNKNEIFIITLKQNV